MVRWSKGASADLKAINRYIARDKPLAAKSWVRRIARCADLAAEMPLAGRVVPEFGRRDVREVFLRSYRIMYRVESDGIFVLTVFEGHRLMGDVDPEVEE